MLFILSVNSSIATETARQCIFSRLFIFEIWCSKEGTKSAKAQQVFEEIVKYIDFKKEDDHFCELLKCVKYLCKKIDQIWKENHRMKEKVLTNNSSWLATEEVVSLLETISSKKQTQEAKKRGRPSAEFSNSSKRTKQRRIARLAETDEAAADALRDLSSEPKHNFSEFNAVEVLALIIETNLTKQQYLNIRSFVNSKLSCGMFPSYEKVLKEKNNSYPESITVTEGHAEVELQNLLDHTASRILDLRREVLSEISDVNNFVLIGKWGFDGSSGYSEYKQRFTNKILDDSNLFVTSYVPLQLVTKSEKPQDAQIIWKNPRPSSTRYCRPIRFQFTKETTQVCIEERNYFKQKIDRLMSTEYLKCERNIHVEHKLQLTMVDGKVCNALSQTSSAKCYICKAKPTEMNDIEACIQKVVYKENYEFGLSPLHSYIRFFEYFIHISYRLGLNKWQIRSQDDKNKFIERKREIQRKFRSEMGLIVDKPKSGGSGTSNDGNTARRFFNNPSLVSSITGIDKELVTRCATLLQAMSSGYKIDADKFKIFALDTAKALVEKYPWYYLPPSVHKILVHGSEVIKNSIVSIGELSEEAAEAKNKDVKRYRLQNTRKMSRISTNTDLIHMLLLSSDPFISGQRKLACTKKSALLKSAIELLQDNQI